MREKRLKYFSMLFCTLVVWSMVFSCVSAKEIDARIDLENTERGSIQVEKQLDDSFTEGNMCYVLQGAEYGVYTQYDSVLDVVSNQVGTLTTNADGLTEELSLPVGTYFVKEIKGTSGYEKEENVFSIFVEKEKKTLLEARSSANYVKVNEIIRKKEFQSNQQCEKEFTEYEICFFGGLWNEKTNPEKLGVEALKRWIFCEDQNGVVKYDDTYCRMGEPLYKNQEGEPILPFGTITVQERRSSNAKSDIQTYVIQLKPEDACGKEMLFETIEIVPPTQMTVENSNETYQLVVWNVDENQNELAGAEFALFEDKDCTKPILQEKANENGLLPLGKLQYGQKYYLKETNAPKGYCDLVDENGQKMIYEIFVEYDQTKNNSILFVNGKQYDMAKLFANENDKSIRFTMVNMSQGKLPATGSGMMIWLETIGIGFGLLAWRRRK